MTRFRALIRIAAAGAATALVAAGCQKAKAGAGQSAPPPQGQVAQRPPVSRIQVHCPSGTTGAFVTPPYDTIAVGNAVQWNMTGTIVLDSVEISLKTSGQRWPFADTIPPHGRPPVQADSATTPGTYSYRVLLWCGVGSNVRRDSIDPVIIIE